MKETEKTDLKQVGFCFEDQSSLRMAQRILVDLARLYLLSTALTFGGTLAASLKADALCDVFLQGNAPFVYLQAVSICGFFVSFMQGKQGKRWMETISRSSFGEG